MDINKILKENIWLFGSNPKVEKINVGFTNTIYIVNNKYIIKICTKQENESKFKNEINFYNLNKNNELVPKLYKYSIDKKEVPYYYEILEKINGVTLYNLWHTLSEKERKNIIKELCIVMKNIHKNKGDKYDWIKRNSEIYLKLYKKAKEMNLFNKEELQLLNKAYLEFPKYLKSNEFVLVHNDMHFDNIFYNHGKIKIIDFERSLYAPKDYELDIIYRMIRKPWKFASEETEKFTNSKDYENIMPYIAKYYPELVNIDNLYKRLSIYNLLYYLENYIKSPNIAELKEETIKSANNIIK